MVIDQDLDIHNAWKLLNGLLEGFLRVISRHDYCNALSVDHLVLSKSKSRPSSRVLKILAEEEVLIDRFVVPSAGTCGARAIRVPSGTFRSSTTSNCWAAVSAGPHSSRS